MNSNNKNKQSSKLNGFFAKVNTVLNNRKKETGKIYFKQPSWNSIFLIASIVLVVAIFYFEFISIFSLHSSITNTNLVYVRLCIICFFIAIGVILSIIITKQKKVNFIISIIYPAMILGLIGYHLTFGINILNEICLAIFCLCCGLSFGLSINLFLYSMDMSEKLITALALVFVLFSYSFFYNIEYNLIIKEIVIPCVVVLFVYIICLLNKESFNAPRTTEIIPKYSIVMIVLVMIVVCLGFATTSVIEEKIHSGTSGLLKSYYSITYYIGFILSIIVTVLNFLFNRKSLIFMITLYFIGLFGAYTFSIFNYMYNPELIYKADILVWRRFADVAFGFATATGYILIIMIVGKILEDKASKKLLLYIVGSFFCYFSASLFLKDVLMSIDFRAICIFMLIFTAFFSLLFSVFSSVGYLESRSGKDTIKGEIDRNQPMYNVINPEEVLTPKEKVVMELLLEGMTLRQIAGELNMKYDSVNFHYKNIYRKLEVNSKIELLLRYGKESN